MRGINVPSSWVWMFWWCWCESSNIEQWLDRVSSVAVFLLQSSLVLFSIITMAENKVVSNAPLDLLESLDSNDEDEEIDESFLCCVCLDLLHKPIVLVCGHISCFWCVHHTMNYMEESHCPICRCPYSHFPSVCQLLHLLLFKMYPVASKRREKQVLEEEQSSDIFSPQLISSSTCKESLSTSSAMCSPKKNMAHYSDTCCSAEIKPLTMEENILKDRTCERISIDDVLCVACKQLLFQPSVLNCGHVYCQSCITTTLNEALRCQSCQRLHPKGSPKVCLELDHLLEKRFPNEYALRRESAKLQTVHDTEGQDGNPHKRSYSSSLGDHGLNVHVGVGCDYCGVYPVVGERYKCMDCVEKVGFDLCGECYNTRSKLPGRFNQNHKPEHKFERVTSNTHLLHNIILRLAEQTQGNLVVPDEDVDDILPFQVVVSDADADADAGELGEDQQGF